MLRTIKRKQLNEQALQYTGDNITDVGNFIGRALVLAPDEHGDEKGAKTWFVYIPNQIRHKLEQGDIIVRDPWGALRVFNDELKFKREYI